MRLLLKITIGETVVAAIAAVFSYLYLPVNRVGISSELIMLGDLNNDNKWDKEDNDRLNDVLANPFAYDQLTLLKIDINRNGLIDTEDLSSLAYVYNFSDPYLSELEADKQDVYFPKPREFFKYLPKYEYVQRPLYSLQHDISNTSPFSILKDL